MSYSTRYTLASLTEPFLQARGPQERPLTVLLQPAKQADKYVTPSAPQTGVKESVWHSQLLLQGEYGSRDEVGVELEEKQKERLTGSVVRSASCSNHCHMKMALKGGCRGKQITKSSGQAVWVPTLRNPGYSLSLGTEMPWPLSLCDREPTARLGLPCRPVNTPRQPKEMLQRSFCVFLAQ